MVFTWITNLWTWTQKEYKQVQQIEHQSFQAIKSIVNPEPWETVQLTHGKTHYRMHGPIHDKTSPLIVFLHGASIFSFVYSRFAQLLVAKGFRVLLFDFYGHGYSSVPNVKYSHQLYKEQLEELMSFLDLWPKPLDDTKDNSDHNLPPTVEIDLGKPFDDQIPKEDTRYYVPGRHSHELYLIGHSMGGLVASEFARAHRHMVTKVVLFNAAGLPVDIQLKNLLPFVLHHLVWLLRRTDLLDAPVHAIGKALTYVGTRFNLTFDDLCYYGNNLDEEVAEEQSKITSGPLALIVQNVPRTLLGPTTNTILSNYRFAKAFHFLLATWLHQLTIEQRSTVLLSISKKFPSIGCRPLWCIA
jgi:pimeloyl-ACP methyl ester carboxylesterase